MISFKPVILGLVLSTCVVSRCSASEGGSIRSRRLSFPSIAGYEPQTLVTDHNALDLDVKVMEDQLKKGRWSEAHHVYMDGGYGKIYAELTLTTPLDKDVPVDTEVTGESESGGTAQGSTLAPGKVGGKKLKVQYKVSSVQDSYVDCQVGALWRFSGATLDGCFKRDGGSIHIKDIGHYNYTYDIHRENKAGRTLQLLGTTVEDCKSCPYHLMEIYNDYYGTKMYADDFVSSAFNASLFKYPYGEIDFRQATNQSRIEAIQKGAVGMNVWMAVIRKMDDAIAECEMGSSRPKTLSWDEAVAFYTGSLEGKDGKSEGVMLHELADERCANFRTCGAEADKASGHSKVNHEIFQQFKFGQRNLMEGECDEARSNKNFIENRMVIPMIQGTLRYAHINSNPSTANEKAAAEGTTFAATILPLVHSCNPSAAAAIHENMNLKASTSFYHVKNAFQETYECMGITCEDVGGYYDAAAGTYFEGAEPCSGSGKSGSSAVGVSIGIIIAVVAVVGGAVFVARRRRMKEVSAPPKKNPIFVTPEEPFT